MAKKAIINTYHSFEEAHQAALRLIDKGIPVDKLNLVGGPAAQNYAAEVAQPKNEQERTLTGIVGGATIGSIVGVALSLALLNLPGVGPLVIGGPLYGVFVGLTGGGVTGGLIGAFTQWGMIEEDAQEYADTIKNDGALLIVQADDTEVERFNRLMTEQSEWNAPHSTKTIDWKEFEAANARQAAPVTEPDHAPAQDKETTLRAGKLPGMPPVESLTETFKQHYQKAFATTGKSFDYYLRAYQYGYILANDDRYRTAEWEKIEPLLGAYWDQQEPNTWVKIREAVHFGRDRSLQPN